MEDLAEVGLDPATDSPDADGPEPRLPPWPIRRVTT
jgi:hypothetical protein